MEKVLLLRGVYLENKHDLRQAVHSLFAPTLNAERDSSLVEIDTVARCSVDDWRTR